MTEFNVGPDKMMMEEIQRSVVEILDACVLKTKTKQENKINK